MRIKTNRKSGFTLVEIMIVVAIIGLLAAIAIPNFVKARTTAQKNACINNLRQIDGAKEQQALELKLKTGDAPTLGGATGLEQYIKGLVMPTCPADNRAYTPGNIGSEPTCLNSGLGHYLTAPAPAPAP